MTRTEILKKLIAINKMVKCATISRSDILQAVSDLISSMEIDAMPGKKT